VCNAWNHWDGCTCGFGGEGHLGGGSGGWAQTVVVRPSTRGPRETAWARWATGHARSDLGEPFTHPTVCPVCRAEIFFHTNGNGDVVFFDELGWPWPKHPHLTTEEGIRVASRSAEIRAVATLLVRPSFIPLPRGMSPAEFDAGHVDRAIYGVVVRTKRGPCGGPRATLSFATVSMPLPWPYTLEPSVRCACMCLRERRSKWATWSG
jgi:hypothetical protein